MYTFCFTGVLMTVCKGLIPDEVCGLFLFPASCPVLLYTVSFKRDFSVFCQLTLVHSVFQRGLFLFPDSCPVLLHTVSFKETFFCFLPIVVYFCTVFLKMDLFTHTFSHKMISDQTDILAVLTVMVITDCCFMLSSKWKRLDSIPVLLPFLLHFISSLFFSARYPQSRTAAAKCCYGDSLHAWQLGGLCSHLASP